MIDQRVSRRSFAKAFGASALGLGLVACGNGSGDVDPNGGTEPGSTDGAVVAEFAAYGEPWLTSIAEGVVTADLAKPDLKDDLYLNVNYEWLRDTEIPTGYESIGSRADVLEAVNDRIAGLILDKTIGGREAEMVREYYGMFLDWDSRARGKEYFLEHLEPIQSIDSMDALSDYLGGEDSLYCGVGMMDLLLDKHQASRVTPSKSCWGRRPVPDVPGDLRHPARRRHVRCPRGPHRHLGHARQHRVSGTGWSRGRVSVPKWNRGRVGCTKMEHLTRPLFHFGTAQPRGPLWKPFLSRHGEQPSARGIMNLHYGRCDITRRKGP